MKKLLLSAILLASINAKAQTKQKIKETIPIGTAIAPDSIIGYSIIVVLDTTQYFNMVNILKSLPIENEYYRYVFDLISGKQKNVIKNPIYKPKK